MAYTTYSEKLQNPLWQKKRLEILTRDNFTCDLCGDKGTTLHVHHRDYIKGRDPWEYDDYNFQTLCKHCHSAVEETKSEEGQGILSVQKQVLEDGSIILHIFIWDQNLNVILFQTGIYRNNKFEIIIGYKKSTLVRILQEIQLIEKNTRCQTEC